MTGAVLALALLGAAQEGAADRVRSLRAEARYAAALEAAEEIAVPADAAFERLEVLYHAGDLGGALRAALAGLEHDPDHRMLLWRGTRLAIDLAATERATELAERLADAVERSAGVDREAWAEVVAGFRAEALALARATERRRAALGRARVVVLVAGALAVVALVRLGCAEAGRGQTSGECRP